MKLYKFGWLALSGDKAKAGRVSVKDRCLSSAQAHAKRRVKADYGLSGYEVHVSLQKVVSKR